MLAARLHVGLEGSLRSTQYGFRKGRSTAEPMFIVRRVQELVLEKRDQALHLVFLDWQKAFDRVDTRCLPRVLGRFGVPAKLQRIVLALVRDPSFHVSMQGDCSEEMRQDLGIRQGCTLSPLLFSMVLSAVMADVEAAVRSRHPMLTTPVVPCVDIEYADDTVLLARTAQIASELLGEVEEQAAKYGLALNRGKTVLLTVNSEELVRFRDGSVLPRSQRATYLGSTLDCGGGTRDRR